MYVMFFLISGIDYLMPRKSKTEDLAYVRKVFFKFGIFYLMTWKSTQAVFAYVRKVFLHSWNRLLSCTECIAFEMNSLEN